MARHLEDFRRLFDTQPAEESELDDLTASRIDGRKALQRLVERRQVSCCASVWQSSNDASS
jgi:hypothetical protein